MAMRWCSCRSASVACPPLGFRPSACARQGFFLVTLTGMTTYLHKMAMGMSLFRLEIDTCVACVARGAQGKGPDRLWATPLPTTPFRAAKAACAAVDIKPYLCVGWSRLLLGGSIELCCATVACIRQRRALLQTLCISTPVVGVNRLPAWTRQIKTEIWPATQCKVWAAARIVKHFQSSSSSCLPGCTCQPSLAVAACCRSTNQPAAPLVGCEPDSLRIARSVPAHVQTS
mmetsp:Transcript_42418/g.127154  ORF Transcript_42418/g.127154 Transcript_42418/m.127154 type:complete len:230 (+) Transcript_42418:904-1593(+)